MPAAVGFTAQKKSLCSRRGTFLLVDKSPGVCNPSALQGELEGAKPASNRIKCRAKPCSARRAWSEANIFVPLRGTKITALFQAVEKSRRLFRQPEKSLCSRRGTFVRKSLLTSARPYRRPPRPASSWPRRRPWTELPSGCGARSQRQPWPQPDPDRRSRGRP